MNLTYVGLIGMVLIGASSFGVATAEPLLLDDFGEKGGQSAFGTDWEYFSDQVMGGVSEGKSRFIATESGRALRLEGTVKLDNNGGFIQVALPLKKGWSSLDASAYTGVRLRVRGNGERYGVHLRTNQTILPWRYFAAEFDTSGEWETIEIPFDTFMPDKGKDRVNAKKLKRLGIVAAFEAMEAQLDVSRVELYRDSED